MIDLAILLLGLFVLFGIAFIGIGIWVMVRMYGKHSVEVDAECVDISVTTETTGVRPADYTHYMNVKRPVYRYWYDGKQYEGMPFLSSNRPGYRPTLGPCKIRINPDFPQKIYSSERKFVAALFIGIGLLYVAISVVAAYVAPL